MDAHAIIRELNSSHGLPREALAAASAQSEVMAPVFIAEIENYIARPDERTEPDAIFFMVHLLAEWLAELGLGIARADAVQRRS